MDILSEEFARKAAAAGDRARLELLSRGLPVFYEDPKTGLDVMEQPDGRRFEIRYIPNSPGPNNYQIVREIVSPAA